MRNSKIKAKPFVKWAGGKRQLLSQFEKYYHDDLKTGNINRYIEPFIGGGAVFFDIVQKYKLNEIFISDINKDLILTYRIIRDRPETLLTELENIQKEYNKLGYYSTYPSEFYYNVRKIYNESIISNQINYNEIRHSTDSIRHAAMFLFLNKTCFNGLYRVNKKGEFNTPCGRYKNPKICDPENILLVSKLLQNVVIKCSDYTESMNYANEKTFYYLDPPYIPISSTSNFTSYTKEKFCKNEQSNLYRSFLELGRIKKSKVMMSNSYSENDGDDYIKRLQKDNVNVYEIFANRSINSNGDKRGKIKELVITNY